MALRGGYRISYYPETTGNIYGAISNPQILSGTFQYSVTNTAQSPDGLPNYGLRSVPQATFPRNALETRSRDAELGPLRWGAIAFKTAMLEVQAGPRRRQGRARSRFAENC